MHKKEGKGNKILLKYGYRKKKTLRRTIVAIYQGNNCLHFINNLQAKAVLQSVWYTNLYMYIVHVWDSGGSRPSPNGGWGALDYEC